MACILSHKFHCHTYLMWSFSRVAEARHCHTSTSDNVYLRVKWLQRCSHWTTWLLSLSLRVARHDHLHFTQFIRFHFQIKNFTTISFKTDYLRIYKFPIFFIITNLVFHNQIGSNLAKKNLKWLYVFPPPLLTTSGANQPRSSHWHCHIITICMVICHFPYLFKVEQNIFLYTCKLVYR